MKKLILTAMLFGVVIISKAQQELTFKPFKFDISAGYGVPLGGNNENGSFLLTLEPKYAISDYITLGLRAETSITINNLETNANVRGTGSYLATGDYYFNTNTVRPFAGIGAGIFTHASADVDTYDGNLKGNTTFGFMPRLGVEIAHFRAALEYNFAGRSENMNKNYLGIKMGVLIGGGRIEY